MLRSKAFFAPIVISCFVRVYSLPRVSVVGSCLLSLQVRVMDDTHCRVDFV